MHLSLRYRLTTARKKPFSPIKINPSKKEQRYHQRHLSAIALRNDEFNSATSALRVNGIVVSKKAIGKARKIGLNEQQIISLFNTLTAEMKNCYLKGASILEPLYKKAQIDLNDKRITIPFSMEAREEKASRFARKALRYFASFIKTNRKSVSPELILEMSAEVTHKFGLSLEKIKEQVNAVFDWEFDSASLGDFELFALNGIYKNFEKEMVKALINSLKGTLAIFRKMVDPSSKNAGIVLFKKGLSGEYDIGENLEAFALALNKTAGLLSIEEFVSLFLRLPAKHPVEVIKLSKVISVFFNNTYFQSAKIKPKALQKLKQMLQQLTKYNQDKILGLIISNKSLYKKMKPQDLYDHFRLQMHLIIRYKRQALSLLEGVIEAINSGIIPAALKANEIKSINKFIAKTNSFVPVVYQIYKTEGDAGLREIKSLARKIARDSFGPSDIVTVFTKYGVEKGFVIISAIIQMAIPLSGASLAQKEKTQELLERFIKAGDLRAHVPGALRSQEKTILLRRKTYELKDGEELDLKVIDPIFKSLRNGPDISLDDLVRKISIYLSDRNKKRRKILRRALYAYASHQAEMAEAIKNLETIDRYALQLLEEMFSDPDKLPKLLTEALAKVPRELLVADNLSITNPRKMVEMILEIWQQNEKREEKIERLSSAVAKYSPPDIREKLIAAGELDQEIKGVLAAILEKNDKRELAADKFIIEIFKKPLRMLQREIEKYELSYTGEEVKLSLRVVKGIPYSFWGWNAGVCTAFDLELWQDPNFKLIPLGENDEIARGFIQVYEIIIHGKKYWTLPGINPTVEFIGTINPEELYDKAMEKIVAFAKKAQVDGVYIPASASIHSNRREIKEVIKNKNYPSKEIPEVNWSRERSYPFDEVLVVWENDSVDN